ncbi:HEAT repeat protein OS=Ureibacillus acetophenoni OX=614649 GN=SAMN05877842_103244 PE=4 SV=1 [Ureibacillus acetophenoni]
MKIVTIEPTPSPNSMKVVVDEELPFGKSFNYTKHAQTAQKAMKCEGRERCLSRSEAIEKRISWESILSEYS